jgi:UbiD family decarboxylase
MQQKKKPQIVARREAPVKEVVKKGDTVNLLEFPALVQHAWDAGPYITAGFLTCFDPDSKIDNCALQRGWISGKREIRVGLGEWSHNGTILAKHEKENQKTRAAFWLGHHPAAYLGAEAKAGLSGKPL